MSRVATFYRFAELEDIEALRERWLPLAEALDLKGTVLLASEGINGTIAGPEAQLLRFIDALRQVPALADLTWKLSTAADSNPVFHRFKIKLKAEIVTFGVDGVRPGQRTGVHVDASQWNALLDDPDVVVIDTRNGYERSIGTFPGSEDPQTTNFREFPDYVREHLDPASNKRVAMFCTGGIRCEKASAFLLNEGFEEVYQLDGGILQYLEDVGADENRWEGECFVFDQRVSVTATLEQGSFEQCYACRHPISADDRAHPAYQPGVSCPHCEDARDDEDREGFRERRRQVVLAEARGGAHIGVAQK